MRITNKELRRRIQNLLLKEAPRVTSQQVSNRANIVGFAELRLKSNQQGSAINLSSTNRSTSLTTAITGLSQRDVDALNAKNQTLNDRNDRIMGAIPNSTAIKAALTSTNVVDVSHIADKDLAVQLAEQIGFGESDGAVGEILTAQVAIQVNKSQAAHNKNAAGDKTAYTNLNSDNICKGIGSGNLNTSNFIGLGVSQFPAFDIMFHDGAIGTGIDKIRLDGTEIILPPLASAKFSGSVSVATSSRTKMASTNRQKHSVGQMFNRGTKAKNAANNMHGIKRGLFSLCLAAIYNGGNSSLALKNVPATTGPYAPRQPSGSPAGTAAVPITFRDAAMLAHDPNVTSGNAMTFGTGANDIQSIFKFFKDCGITTIKCEGVDGYNLALIPHLNPDEMNIGKQSQEPVYFLMFSPLEKLMPKTSLDIAGNNTYPGIVPENGTILHGLGDAVITNVLAVAQFGTVSNLIQYAEASVHVLARQRLPAVVELTANNALMKLERMSDSILELPSATQNSFKVDDGLENLSVWLNAVWHTTKPSLVVRHRQLRTEVWDKMYKRVETLSIAQAAFNAIVEALGNIDIVEFNTIMNDSSGDFKAAQDNLRNAFKELGKTPNLTTGKTQFNRQLTIDTLSKTLLSLRTLTYAVHLFDDGNDKVAVGSARTKGGVGSENIVNHLIEIHNALMGLIEDYNSAKIISSKDLNALRTYSNTLTQNLSSVGRNIDSSDGTLSEVVSIADIEIEEDVIGLVPDMFLPFLESVQEGADAVGVACEKLSEEVINATGVIKKYKSMEFFNAMIEEYVKTYPAPTDAELTPEEEAQQQPELEVNPQQDLSPELEKIYRSPGSKSYEDINADPSMTNMPAYTPALQQSQIPSIQQAYGPMEESGIYENILKKLLYTIKKKQ
jgi:hypothetical protein